MMCSCAALAQSSMKRFQDWPAEGTCQTPQLSSTGDRVRSYSLRISFLRSPSNKQDPFVRFTAAMLSCNHHVRTHPDTSRPDETVLLSSNGCMLLCLLQMFLLN